MLQEERLPLCAPGPERQRQVVQRLQDVPGLVLKVALVGGREGLVAPQGLELAQGVLEGGAEGGQGLAAFILLLFFGGERNRSRRSGKRKTLLLEDVFSLWIFTVQ